MLSRAVVWILAVLPLLALGPGCGDASAPGLERRSAQEVNATAPPETRRGPTSTTAPTPASTADAGDPGYRDPARSDAGCNGPTNKVCDGRCVSVSNEVAHCGDCNRACTGPSAICIAGGCACGDVGFTYCPALGGCIDTRSDDNNCGDCGRACGANETCRNGQCAEM
jgi:hypothetical protein